MSVASTTTLLAVMLSALLLSASSRLALQVIACLGLAVSVANTALALRRRAVDHVGRIVVHFGCLFWFFLPGFTTSLTPLQFRRSLVHVATSNHDALLAYVAVSMFYAAFSSANAIQWPKRWTRIAGTVFGGGIDVSTRSLVRVLSVACVVGIGFYVVQAGNPVAAVALLLRSRDASKPWAAGGNFGNEVTPFANLSMSLLVVVANVAGGLLVQRRHPIHRRILLLSLFITATAWVSIDNGTRSTLLTCVLAPAFFWLRRAITARSGRRQARFIAFLVMAALIVLAGSAQRAYRDHATRAGEDPTIGLEVNDNDFLTLTAVAFAIQRAEAGHLHQPTPMLLLSGPVPRFLWPGKPVPKSIELTTDYIRGFGTYAERGGNNLPSMVGAEYMNWGWLGVLLLGVGLGAASHAGDRFFRSTNSLVGQCAYLVTLGYLFVSFRAILFGWFFPVLLFVAWLATLQIGGARRRNERSGRSVVSTASPTLSPESARERVGSHLMSR